MLNADFLKAFDEDQEALEEEMLAKTYGSFDRSKLDQVAAGVRTFLKRQSTVKGVKITDEDIENRLEFHFNNRKSYMGKKKKKSIDTLAVKAREEAGEAGEEQHETNDSD